MCTSAYPFGDRRRDVAYMGESQPMTSPTLDEARWTARLLQTNLIYSCVRSEAPVNPLEHLKYAPHLMPRRNAEHFHLKT
ncbi:hypothetical protein SFRURICE_019350, partial [Spodoptera frugiperda]